MLVRVSMGMSFDDESSLVESIEFLHIASHKTNSVTSVVGDLEESINNDYGIQEERRGEAMMASDE